MVTAQITDVAWDIGFSFRKDYTSLLSLFSTPQVFQREHLAICTIKRDVICNCSEFLWLIPESTYVRAYEVYPRLGRQKLLWMSDQSVLITSSSCFTYAT